MFLTPMTMSKYGNSRTRCCQSHTHDSKVEATYCDHLYLLTKAGEVIKVKVIEIKDDKVSLSIKALIEDPWKAAGAKYKKDQKVDAVVIKYNKYGALASVEEGVAG